MAQRVYVPFMMFGVRMVNMQFLWSPSLEYQGKPTQKPNYFITCVTPKTRAGWWEEPILAPAWAAYDQLLQKSGMTLQHISEWPIKDGDMPPEPGKSPSEWAKGHWVLGGSSSQAIKAEIVQNGNVVPLPAKVGVKPGDFVALGCSAAIKQNNPRALKHFCNTVLFTAAGEEIAVGNSVSGAELMRTAQSQGLQVAGFNGSPGGFPGGFQPQPGPGQYGGPQGHPGSPGGFQAQPGQFPGGFQPQPGQFPGGTQPGFFPGTPQGPQPGFAPPNTGTMPTVQPGVFAGAPAPGGMPGGPGGNATYPSNPAPGGWPQFNPNPGPQPQFPGPGNAQFAPNPGPQWPQR